MVTACLCNQQVFALPDLKDITFRNTGTEVRDFIADFADINFNLFCKEAFLVASCAAPVYVAAHAIDETVHRQFYDESCHKNTCDIGCLRLCLVEDMGIAVPIAALSIGCWISKNDDTSLLGRDLLAGMFSIWIAKDIVKNCVTRTCCYRPYSGLFPKKLVMGGFPSGHAATLTFTTVLLGLQKGIYWALPAGLYAIAVGGGLLACNYHYVSQIVAGAALGSLFAVAAHRVINERLDERFSFEFYSDERGRPMIGAAYSF
jgi:membrane-associated phospholipid phosphatase